MRSVSTLNQRGGDAALAVELRAWAELRRGDFVAELTALTDLDAPSQDVETLKPTARLLCARLARLGAQVETIESAAGPHLIAKLGVGAGPAVAILGHYDTVWPKGTAAARPFRIEDGTAIGPGVFDMRGGLVAALGALEALVELGGLRRPVIVMLTADEESGSRTSEGMIRGLADSCDVVLIPEPPLPDGSLKTARKGVQTYRLELRGKAAHAGIEPGRGVSAVHALTEVLGTVLGISRPEAGTTINVGRIEGGIAPNVVASSAAAEVDVRVVSEVEYARAAEAFQALNTGQPGATLIVERVHGRPPMERTPAIAQVAEQAKAVAAGLGLELGEGTTGGASDGNFLAPLGVAVLDGLGPEGAGAHSLDERITMRSLEERVVLLAALINHL